MIAILALPVAVIKQPHGALSRTPWRRLPGMVGQGVKIANGDHMLAGHLASSHKYKQVTKHLKCPVTGGVWRDILQWPKSTCFEAIVNASGH